MKSITDGLRFLLSLICFALALALGTDWITIQVLKETGCLLLILVLIGLGVFFIPRTE